MGRHRDGNRRGAADQHAPSGDVEFARSVHCGAPDRARGRACVQLRATDGVPSALRFGGDSSVSFAACLLASQQLRSWVAAFPVL